MLAKTGVQTNPNPPDFGLTALLALHLPAPDFPFLLFYLTVDNKVSYVSGSLSREHITPPLTKT